MIGCRDCRFSHIPAQGGEPICEHPLSYGELPDYWTGEMRIWPRPISVMRSIGQCRRDALLFEARNATTSV